MEEDGALTEVKKLGRNSRKVRIKISIGATLDDVWAVLTDYERMPEYLPTVTVCKIVERQQNRTRIHQVGHQNLVLGLKVAAKMVMDFYEKDVEVSDSGKRRNMEFKMVESDFQIFEGNWCVEQLNKETAEDNESSPDEEHETTLTYEVEIKPKPWIPIQLVEGMFVREINTSHMCIRKEAEKLAQNARSSR